jgi:DASS family divalent anion:Na+ symporter
MSLLVGSGMVILSVSRSLYCFDSKVGKFLSCTKCTKGIHGCEPFAAALDGYSSHIVWLVFAAFQIGKAVEVTKISPFPFQSALTF